MKRVITIITIIFVLYSIAFFVSRNMESTSLVNKIAIIPIYGEITIGDHEPLYEQQTAASNAIIAYLELAEKDSSIKGIILEINSPGGAVVASSEVAQKVKEIKKPVVSLIREVGASGAYWIASASDAIVANPLSITGSIGVISTYLEFSELLEKYGIKASTITAGEFKDTGSPFRSLTDEEKVILQNKINMIHNEFVSSVSENRKIDVSKYATGMFYLGKEAKDIGLIDYLGDKNLAINITKQLANIKEAEIVQYKQPANLLSVLKQFTSEFGINIGKGISSNLVQESKISV
jgi:protease-4